MALCVAGALNWRGIPSCGFAASRKAIYLFDRRRIQGGKVPLNTTGAAVIDVKASRVSILVCRPVCQVPVLSPSHQLHQQHTNINALRGCNKSSRASRPVFKRVNPSVHHDDGKQETTSRTSAILCVCACARVCVCFAWSNIHVNISRTFPLFTSFVRPFQPVSHWTNIRVS